MIDVVHLGTGTAWPDPERGPTATLLKATSGSVLVDCGSGTLQKLRREVPDFGALHGLLLTHMHLDHSADLLPWLFAHNVPGFARQEPLPIVLHTRALAEVEALRSALGTWLDAAQEHVVWQPVEPGESFVLGPWEVETFAVHHSASSVGYRLVSSCGATIVIPGDTGPTPGLARACDGADLVVLECGVPDAFAMETHLSPMHWRELLQEARAGAWAMVHRYPLLLENLNWLEALKASTEQVVLTPEDGDRMEIHGKGSS